MPGKGIKRSVLCLIGLLSVLLVSGCFAGKEPAKQEKLRAPRPSEDAVRDKYDMELVLDTDAKTLEGSVKIHLTNTSQDTWEQLCFRDYIFAIGRTFDEMRGLDSGLRSEFRSVYDMAAKEILDYARADDDESVVFVTLNSPLEPGESMQMQWDYKASIPENAFRYRYTAQDNGKKLLFELANFYPVLSIYEDGDWQRDPFYYEGECFYSKCADYSLTLTVPEEYTVVSSGTEEKGASDHGLCVWRIEADNMRDVGVTASNYLAMLEDSSGEVAVRCYYFDNEVAKKQAELMLATAVNALKFYEQKIGGSPYPTLDVVMTDDLIGAIEFPAYVRVGDYSSQMDEDKNGYITSLITENTAHEVAHQWFYAAVGNNGYQEPWLDESFASFCQLAYHLEGLLEKEQKELVSQTRPASQGEGEQEGYLNLPYDKLGSRYLSAVYERGKFFLFDLMNAMGEEWFYRMLQEYYKGSAFQEAHTNDFMELAKKYANNKTVVNLLKENIKE